MNKILNFQERDFEILGLKNVCSSRTNLGLIHYSKNQFQCNRGMVYNG